MKRIYIAGPYSQGDVCANVDRAMRAWHALADAGFAPFCPHLSHFLHIQRQRTYEEWLEQDLAWLPGCSGLLRLAGPSSGAAKEAAAAVKLGIPTFLTVADVVEYFRETKS